MFLTMFELFRSFLSKAALVVLLCISLLFALDWRIKIANIEQPACKQTTARTKLQTLFTTSTYNTQLLQTTKLQNQDNHQRTHEKILADMHRFSQPPTRNQLLICTDI